MKKTAKVWTLRPENRFKLDPEFVVQYMHQQPQWGYGLISYITFKRTYARPVSKEQLAEETVRYLGLTPVAAAEAVSTSTQTSEEYWQTCVRVVEGHSSILKQHVRDTGQPWSDAEEQHHAQEMFRRIWTFKFTPPGRGFWTMGTDVMEIKGSGAANNCFSGDTTLITKEYGVVPFKEIVGETIHVQGQGGWQSAEVRSFGIQKLQKVEFAPAYLHTGSKSWRRSSSKMRHTLEATANHRWILVNGSETTELKVGDVVKSSRNLDTSETELYRSGKLHGLIFGDGTAGQWLKPDGAFGGLRTHHIRLCGAKAQACLDLFSRVSYPPSYNGDPWCAINTARKLKDFPRDDAHPDYMRGFLDGWIVADSSDEPSGTKSLASQHTGAAAWLKRNAARAGWLLTGISEDPALVTNFGPRKSPLFIYCLTKAEDRGWKVTSISKRTKRETVFCAVVPGERAFTLSSGIYTGNCGFVSTDCMNLDFSRPFCELMDWSMLGVGVGFDMLGAKHQIHLVNPSMDPTAAHVVADTREGWIECVRIVLEAFVGKSLLPVSWDYTKLRREGAPLKTFGGTSSGYKPLEALIEAITRLCYSYLSQHRAVDSTFITDVQNFIGKCVVAGNIRRSSEIAIGSPDDANFRSLKDNTALNALFAEASEKAAANVKWAKLQKKIAKLKAGQTGLSVLDPVYATLQLDIDKLEKSQKKLLHSDPAWSAVNRSINAHPLMSHRWASNNSVLADGVNDYAELAASTELNGEPGYAWLENMRAYGRMVDPPNWKDRKAVGTNPCAEQTLHDGELCNLVESYPAKHDSLEDFLTTIKYAYRYAKAVTLVPTHNSRTNAVMIRNRRIGMSMAGVIELYERIGMAECIRWWDEGYKEVCKWDTEYSSWLGVNESIKKTSVKPGGSVPLLAGLEGGMKSPIAPFYMRTIRIGYQSPLVKALRDAGYRVEPDRTTPRTEVVYFPQRAPEGVRTSEDISLWEQAAIFTNLQKFWSDNMVSATLMFKPNEGKDIKKILKMYEGQWKGVSFLPLSNHGFLQAPYIPCTKDEYDLAVSKLKPLEIDGLTVSHDQDEKFCSGGLCEVVPK